MEKTNFSGWLYHEVGKKKYSPSGVNEMLSKMSLDGFSPNEWKNSFYIGFQVFEEKRGGELLFS